MSDFNESLISLKILEKRSNIKFHENPFSGSGAVPCGRTYTRTDMTKLTDASRDLANAPKNKTRCRLLKTSDIRFKAIPRRYTQLAQCIQRVATGWTVRGSITGGSEIFPTHPSPALGPTQPPAHRVPFPGLKRPGSGVNHPPPFSEEVKERVDL